MTRSKKEFKIQEIKTTVIRSYADRVGQVFNLSPFSLPLCVVMLFLGSPPPSARADRPIVPNSGIPVFTVTASWPGSGSVKPGDSVKINFGYSGAPATPVAVTYTVSSKNPAKQWIGVTSVGSFNTTSYSGSFNFTVPNDIIVGLNLYVTVTAAPPKPAIPASATTAAIPVQP